jgi:hypothetical protein
MVAYLSHVNIYVLGKVDSFLVDSMQKKSVNDLS